MSEDADWLAMIRYDDKVGILFVEFLNCSGDVTLFSSCAVRLLITPSI